VLGLSQRIVGIDEAGRGPVIGPLVIAGVVIEPSQEEALIEWGVRDSKDLTSRRRELLDRQIRQLAKQVEVLEVSAQDIDKQRRLKRSLNVLEADWMAQVLNRLTWQTAYVDASDVNAERYGRMIATQLKTPRKIISEHKADSMYPVVAAASIIAKVQRDRRIQEFHRSYGDFGSGYPNDPKTKRFLVEWLRSHDDFPAIVRDTWETAQNLRAQKWQRKL
jgi:ribonuclease HII